jgi:hypothetical protein
MVDLWSLVEGGFGDLYGHPIHWYKGRWLLFNHGDLEGETRLEMTGSTCSIRIRTQTKKLIIKFCMWFQVKLLSFYSNLCCMYKISQISLELKHKKIPSSISALSESGLVLYSSSPFQRCAQLFLEPNIRREGEVTSWIPFMCTHVLSALNQVPASSQVPAFGQV